MRELAEAEGVDPQELDVVLQHYVSTEAIRRLADHDRASWRLQFETPDHLVEITEDNAVLADGEER